MEKNFKNVINFVRGRKKNPRHGFALCQEGVIFYDEDKNDLALQKFIEAEKEGYESADMFCNMSWLYGGFKQEWQKSEKYAQKALKCDEKSGRAYLLLGNIYFIKDTPEGFDKALEYYLKSIEYDYICSSTYERIAYIYVAKKDNFLKYFEYINKAIELDPKNGQLYGAKAETYMEMNNFKSALKNYLKALELGYGVDDTYYNFQISFCYSKLGDIDKAIEYANRVIFLDKTSGVGYYRKGFAYFWVQDFKRAKEAFLQAEEKKYDRADMYARMSVIYNVESDFEKAIYYAQKAIKTDKTEYDGYVAMTDIYAHQRKYKDALKWIKKAYRVTKGNLEEDFQYAQYSAILFMFHRYKDALKFANEGLSRFSDSVDLLDIKAGVLQATNKYDEAEIEVKKMIELAPTDVRTIQQQANQKICYKQYEEGLKIVLSIDIAKIEPDELDSQHSIIAECYCKMKNYDKSIDYFYKLTKSEHFAEYATMNYKTVKSVYATLQKTLPNDERMEFISSQMTKAQEFLKDLGL